MWRSLKIGKLFGIGVYIHWSFLLIIGFVLYTYGIQGGWRFAIFGLELLLAGFACVVLHEYGHALMARWFGIATRDITLYPIGGVARLERMSENPVEELLIALAGPAVNVVIALLLLPVNIILYGSSMATVSGDPEVMRNYFWLVLLFFNIMMVLFNMLPAFPMDGGRVLRALLALSLGRLTATHIAALVGAGFAFIFAMSGVFAFSNPMLVLIGVFIFLMGRMELAMVRYQEAQRRARPLDVLPADGYHTLDALPVDLEAPFTWATWDPARRVWILRQGGWPIHTFRAE
jgi:Zn-dependent protease